MQKLYPHTVIVCEGPSEVAYIQKLNRLLREIDMQAILSPKPVHTGIYKTVMDKYKAEKKNNPRTKISVWVDYDLYARNNSNCMTGYNETKDKVPFMFSKQNFEDFLALHLDDEKLNNWLNVCNVNNHFRVPMHENVYEPLVKQHLFSNYEKGDLPFELTLAMIGNLFRHHADPKIPLRSDFTDFLKRIFELKTDLPPETLAT